jgi:hypothetical protein
MLFNLLGAVGLVGLLSGCDSGGTTSGSAVANVAPVITSTAAPAGTQGTAYSYDVNATDPDGDTLTYSLVPTVVPSPVPPSLVEPVPFGMTIDSASGVISWTPAAQTGDNLVTVQVSDGNLSSTQLFKVTVVAETVTQLAPVFITPTALPTAFENTAYSTTVIAADGNNDEITYSITTAPTGPSQVAMTIHQTTGRITWTPGVGQAGTRTVTVQATDPGGLFASQTFTINVNTATAANGVTFGFDDLTRGGYNVTQPGIWTNEGPDAFATFNGSAIIVRGDLTVIMDSKGRPIFNNPEFMFLGVTLINRGSTDTTFAIAGYIGEHGVTNFYYTVTVKVGEPPVIVQNSLFDNSGRPMNVSIERLEVNGNSLFSSTSLPDFGVSCLGVGTAGGAPICP